MNAFTRGFVSSLFRSRGAAPPDEAAHNKKSTGDSSPAFLERKNPLSPIVPLLGVDKTGLNAHQMLCSDQEVCLGKTPLAGSNPEVGGLSLPDTVIGAKENLYLRQFFSLVKAAEEVNEHSTAGHPGAAGPAEIVQFISPRAYHNPAKSQDRPMSEQLKRLKGGEVGNYHLVDIGEPEVTYENGTPSRVFRIQYRENSTSPVKALFLTEIAPDFAGGSMTEEAIADVATLMKDKPRDCMLSYRGTGRIAIMQSVMRIREQLEIHRASANAANPPPIREWLQRSIHDIEQHRPAYLSVDNEQSRQQQEAILNHLETYFKSLPVPAAASAVPAPTAPASTPQVPPPQVPPPQVPPTPVPPAPVPPAPTANARSATLDDIPVSSNKSYLTAGLMAIVETGDKARLGSSLQKSLASLKRQEMTLGVVKSLLETKTPSVLKFDNIEELAKFLDVRPEDALNTLIDLCGWRSAILDHKTYHRYARSLKLAQEDLENSKALSSNNKPSYEIKLMYKQVSRDIQSLEEKFFAAAHFKLSQVLLDVPIPKPSCLDEQGRFQLVVSRNQPSVKIKPRIKLNALVARTQEGIQRLGEERERIKLLDSAIVHTFDYFSPETTADAKKAITPKLKGFLKAYLVKANQVQQTDAALKGTGSDTASHPHHESALSFLKKFNHSIQNKFFVSSNSICLDLSRQSSNRKDGKLILQTGKGAVANNSKAKLEGLLLLEKSSTNKRGLDINDISNNYRLADDFTAHRPTRLPILHVGFEYPSIEVETAGSLTGGPKIKSKVLGGLHNFHPNAELIIKSENEIKQLKLKPKLIVVHEGNSADSGHYSTWFKTPEGRWRMKGSDDYMSSTEFAELMAPDKTCRPVYVTYEAFALSNVNLPTISERPTSGWRSKLQRPFRRNITS
ncbi:hypothetical protein [Limnobacter parvus]|uniref:Uncharacterized protein n=1 Tax=Limnobacter parvus TaxID=2939690 RepID=A0ABT1XFX5_9BURK|nr:hypothetical protein [Limnobacter parvus]MCR2746175.1 hypothetical protein [Limnobacter parvus]